MSLRCNYNAWKHFFYGTNLSKKKCLQKFYEFIFYNGLSDKKFRKRRQRNKIKKVIKCVYHLFLKSDEEDKNKLYLYFEMIDCILFDDGFGITERSKAQLLYFIQQMKFMKMKVWRTLIPELQYPLKVTYVEKSKYLQTKTKVNIWKPPKERVSKNKRKVLSCSYLNRFLSDETFMKHHLRDFFVAYEELEEIEEDLEEEIAIIKKLVDPFQRETMRNYNFYKKHQNYIDNFRVMASEKKDILNVDKYLKH